MKRLICSFLLVCSCIYADFGQDMKIKFGKIDPSALSMSVYEPDSSAQAVILSKKGSIRYDYLQEKYPLEEERHVVVKLLKTSSLDEFGNVEIPYYTFNDYSKIGTLKAVVHLPDGTDVKVDNSQIFDEKTNEYWSSKKIAFPKLVTGAVLEYQYTLSSSGMLTPVDWFFQAEVPIVYSELTTYFPEWFEYVVLTQGAPLDKHTTENVKEQISLSNIVRGQDAKDRTERSISSVDVRFIRHTYVNADVPALKKECCITTMDDYFSRVRYQLKAYQFPNSPRKAVMNSWKKLADELYEIPEWGGQLRNKRPGELVLEAAGIAPGKAVNPMETVKKIYDYVNQNIQWNEVYSYSFRKDIGSLLKTKSGNSGDLNKMICAALIQAGIDAKPVLLSTRSHSKPLELYPFIEQFNHLVVLAKIEGMEVWIDAGNPYRPVGLLRIGALNGKGWVADDVEPYWIDITPPASKTVIVIKGSLDKEGNLAADLEGRFTGYHAVQARKEAAEQKEKYGAQLIGSSTVPVNLTSLEWLNTEDISMPFQFRAKMISHPTATATPDKIYFNPVFPIGFDQSPFKLEERTYPIEMEYPSEISMILNLDLPEGYVVESMPEPIRFVTENNGIQVTYDVSMAAGKLNITMKYIIKQLVFEPAEYPVLKNIFDQRKQKMSEQIVLTKA